MSWNYKIYIILTIHNITWEIFRYNTRDCVIYPTRCAPNIIHSTTQNYISSIKVGSESQKDPTDFQLNNVEVPDYLYKTWEKIFLPIMYQECMYGCPFWVFENQNQGLIR